MYAKENLILNYLKDNQQLFDIFVAKQEYCSEKDEHGRFLYRFSNYKDVLKPIVSEYSVSKGFPVEWLESTSTLMDELECIIMYDV
jgi:hypothetical protein